MSRIIDPKTLLNRPLRCIGDEFQRLSVSLFMVILLGALIALGGFQKSYAQPEEQEPPRGEQQFRNPGERLEQFKKLRLIEVLNLNEEGSVRFFARYNKFQEDQRQIQQERMQVVKELGKLVHDGAKEQDYQPLFDKVFATDQKLLEAKSRFFNDLKDVLTTEQMAKYIVFEQNFARDVREIMQELQRERMWNRMR